MGNLKYLFLVLLFLFLIKPASAEYGWLGSNYVLGGLGSTGSYVTIPHNTIFNQSSDGTFEMWIYPTTFNNNLTLISKGATANPSFLWYINPTTRLMTFRIGNVNYTNTGGIQIPQNQWSHVAVTWVGGPNFTVTFYLNGAVSGSSILLNAAWPTNTDPVRIGGSQYAPADFFAGKIDEARFWNVARIQIQLAENRFIGLGDGTNANLNSALTGSNSYFGLVSSWTFNRTTSASDDISGLNGTYSGSASSQTQDAGPIPYNFVLKMGDNNTSYLKVPHNTIFNQNGHGTIELWYKANSLTHEQIFISKGSTVNTTTFAFGVNTSGKLVFRTGANPVASNGSSIAANRWYHLAVTWALNGNTYDVKFYVNGIQNGGILTIPNSFPTNTNELYIGGSQALPDNFVTGLMDELRFFDPVLTDVQINNNMFNSLKTFMSTTTMIAAWNFDGNLKNFSTQGASIDASFYNANVSSSKLSAYVNENTTGAFSTTFIAYPTVINRGGTPNAFPLGFIRRNVNMNIPDNNITGISDSIMIYNPTGPVNNIEVFLSIKHTYMADLVVKLRAPNGVERNILLNYGGAGDNVLSFFNDAFSNLPTSTTYLPPWGFVRPVATMGNFGGATINGSWKLTAYDNFGSDVGYIESWGIRFNNAVDVTPVSNEIPTTFALNQNYPNPFNPVTTINFSIPENKSNVKIVITDLTGRHVETLIDKELDAGIYDINWNGSRYSSGTYFYSLIIDGIRFDTKKMILIK